MEELAGLGDREVVLTGVDLGQYELDHSPPFQPGRPGATPGVQKLPFRVRLSSLEPQDGDPGTPGRAGGLAGLLPPLPSASPERRRPGAGRHGRPYGPERFRDLVREITRRFPGAGLGLDVLVGFPGETDADFEATRSLVADSR